MLILWLSIRGKCLSLLFKLEPIQTDNNYAVGHYGIINSASYNIQYFFSFLFIFFLPVRLIEFMELHDIHNLCMGDKLDFIPIAINLIIVEVI